ncbi:thiol-disulfide oxidoreductase DCC family protein [Shewanella sp. 0m-4]
MAEVKATIIFDGVCNLCDGAVQFVRRHDPEEHFNFVALQSIQGQALLAQYQLSHLALDSVILIKQGRYYLRSDAVIEIANSLTGMAVLLRYLRFFPKPIREGSYNLLAKYRYRLFGKKNSCNLR